MKALIAVGVAALSVLMLLLTALDVLYGDGSMLANRLAVGVIAAAFGIPAILASVTWTIAKLADA